MFWAANAILLVALFPEGEIPSNPVGMVISAVGAGLSFVWYKIQNRAIGHVIRHETLMEKLEKDLLGSNDQKYAVSANVNQENYNNCVGKGIRARRLMPICSRVAIILWILAFLFFFIKLICTNV